MLFDDGPRVLQGLQRMLPTKRSEWPMAFTDNQSEALQRLAVEPYDVVVRSSQC